MGYDVGAAGAFGILLSGSESEKLAETVRMLFDRAVEMREEDDFDIEQFEDRVHDEFIVQLLRDYNDAGIVIPVGARLIYTGSEDDRPGRTDTPADQWILGFGMLTNPWHWPEMHESFRKAASFHTWVWGG